MIGQTVRRWIGVVGLALLVVAAALIKADIGAGRSRVLAVVGVVLLAAGALWNLKAILDFLVQRSVRAGTSTAVYSTIVLGAVILGNFLAARHNWRWDATENRSFSLSERTRRILETLPADVRIVAMFPDDSRAGARAAREILEVFRYESRRIHVDYVDPVKRPDVPARYGVDIRKGKGSVVVEMDGKPPIEARPPDEEGVAGAILDLVRPSRRRICFLTGHGERRIDDSTDGGLESAASGVAKRFSYEVGTISLQTEGKVPSGCDVVVIAGPRSPFAQDETRALLDYMSADGHLLLLADPTTRANEGDVLRPLFDRWGVEFDPDVVVDRRGGRGRFFTPIISDFERGFSLSRAFVGKEIELSGACSVKWREAVPKDPLLYHSDLAFAAPEAWAARDVGAYSEDRIPTYDSRTDTLKPRIAVCAYRRSWEDAAAPAAVKTDKREGRIAVVGDSDFAANASLPTRFNKEWFESLVNWLAREELLVAPPPASADRDRFVFERTGVTARDKYQVLYLCMMPPALVIIAGLLVFMKRRKL